MAGFRKKPGRSGYEVHFYTHNKVRRSIWLGGFSLRQCRNFVRHVDELLRAAKANDAPEATTAAWLADLDGPLREKLISFGLADALARKLLTAEQRTVGNWTQAYIDTMVGSTWRTRNNYGQAREWLLKHVSELTDIGCVTTEDLIRWQRSMKSELALATRNKHVQRVQTMFRSAANDRVIRENPALALKQERPPNGRRVDRSRQFFVDADITKLVLDGLPDTTWKLIFCLLRFQGFRRHEVFRLEWSHVDWANNRLQVHSTKTGYRECPIFQETLPLLQETARIAPGATKVITWSGSEDSLTALLGRQIKLLTPGWPKACQQLRSTRRTELEALFPSYVVDEWLGHDAETAQKHYLQVTPAHWAAASSLSPVCSTTCSTASDSNSGTTVERPTKPAIFPDVHPVYQYPRHDLNVRPQL